jgi:hypothetical protein
VPVQESLGADDCGKSAQAVSAQLFGLGCQPMALVIVESGLSAQLLPQNLDLFLEVFDNELLVTIQPARKADEQELQRVHRPILPNSFCSHEPRPS